MRVIVLLFVAALAACGPPDTSSPRWVSPNQEPSNLTPGVNVSGSVDVGVVRSY